MITEAMPRKRRITRAVETNLVAFMRELPHITDRDRLLELHRHLHAMFNELSRSGKVVMNGMTLPQIKIMHDKVVERLQQLDPTFRHDSPIRLPDDQSPPPAPPEEPQPKKKSNDPNTPTGSAPQLVKDLQQTNLLVRDLETALRTCQRQLSALQGSGGGKQDLASETLRKGFPMNHCKSCSQKRSSKYRPSAGLSKSQALESVQAMTWPSLTGLRPDLTSVARMHSPDDVEAEGNGVQHTAEPLPPGMLDEDTLKAAFGQILNLEPTDPMLDEIVNAVIDILEENQAVPLTENGEEIVEQAPPEEAAQEAVNPLSGRLMHLVGGKDFNTRTTVLESELQRARLPQPMEQSVRRRFANRRATRESVRAVINEYQHLTRDLIHTSAPATNHHGAVRANEDNLSVTEQAFVQQVASLMNGS